MNKPFAITLDVGSSLANHTGTWRTARPAYVDRLPPCNHACPAGENIQGWLFRAEEGAYEEAWRLLMRDNPLPAVMGRVCYHNCETACNRGSVDQAVNIHAIERFLGDLAIERGWLVAPELPDSGKSVVVIGAGPSGLSAAYHLAMLGHRVTVYDSGQRGGGMMRYGIPRYRLPRSVLDAEIARIEAVGVKMFLGHRVDDLSELMARERYDAAFLAVGAHIAKRAWIPAGDAGHILDAVSILKDMEGAEPPRLGRRVVVYGGGNTAFDVARTARRLGALETIVVYRRTREQMPAHEFELQEALQEGVMVKWLSTITQEEGGKLTLEKMTLDAHGVAQPTGEFETIEADSVVLALGQEVDLGLLAGAPEIVVHAGAVQVDNRMMTGRRGVFAGGDMIPAERNVTVAVGHGKKAARHIDAWLRGADYRPAAKHAPANAERLNAWYYSDAPKAMQPILDIVRRESTFAEVQGGLDSDNALFEARRCLSCGNCFECDNCYGVCPDNAIVKLGPGLRYAVNYDYCKGCGLCAAECPCGAIDMVPETI